MSLCWVSWRHVLTLSRVKITAVMRYCLKNFGTWISTSSPVFRRSEIFLSLSSRINRFSIVWSSISWVQSYSTFLPYSLTEISLSVCSWLAGDQHSGFFCPEHQWRSTKSFITLVPVGFSSPPVVSVIKPFFYAKNTLANKLGRLSVASLLARNDRSTMRTTLRCSNQSAGTSLTK